MPFGRFIVSHRATAATEAKDAVVNTLYFNISNPPVGGPDWTALTTDLYQIFAQYAGIGKRYLDVRSYDMGDATPRPVKHRQAGDVGSVTISGVPQVALCLSYYADRNLPRQRGRIYLGPWSTAAERPTSGQRATALGLAQRFADLGGVNVDWSLWSPTTQTHTRINHAWVDDSWDIIRSRKIPRTTRETWTGDG